MTRQVLALIAAVAGAIVMYLAASPESGFTTVFIGFWLGLGLFIAVLAIQLQHYRPGVDAPSADEIHGAGEWRWWRFLSHARAAAPLYLGFRLFLGYAWLSSGWAKFQNPAWRDTGTALKGFWTRAVAVSPEGTGQITYPAYRAFLQFMLDNEWYTWFSKIILTGELLVGIGILLGGLTAIAAFGGLLLNFSFLWAGVASTNPTLIIMEALILIGWRTSGWWGLDRILLPMVMRSRGHQTDALPFEPATQRTG